MVAWFSPKESVMSPSSVVEWGGAVFGIVGAALVAMNNRYRVKQRAKLSRFLG